MKTRREARLHRKLRIRAKVSGTAARPRLAVFRSNKALYVQLIDDTKGKTIASSRVAGKTIAKAKELGALVSEVAKKKKITTVVFDRGGGRFHGVIKALADTCREGGLTI